jgi:uncharacterized cupin superfamily protein
MTRTNIVNEKEIDWTEQAKGNRFQFRRKSLSSYSVGERLGCSLYEIQPGKSAWPYHYHLSNEEAIFILAGRGTLRIGGEKSPVSAGDYVSLPAGKIPHQLINDSDEILRYICFSTMNEPDIGVYPDSEKIGVFAGSAPGGAKDKRTYHKYFLEGSDVDYWDGEEV